MNLAKAMTLLIAMTATTLATASDLTLVKFHADWCGKCKVLAPVVMNLETTFKGQPVRFVEFDRTNRDTTAQAVALAKSLGLTDVYNSNRGTGYLLLVDAENGKVLERFTTSTRKDEIAKQIQTHLNPAS